jgi:hypothetical protein
MIVLRVIALLTDADPRRYVCHARDLRDRDGSGRLARTVSGATGGL